MIPKILSPGTGLGSVRIAGLRRLCWSSPGAGHIIVRPFEFNDVRKNMAKEVKRSPQELGLFKDCPRCFGLKISENNKRLFPEKRIIGQV